MTDPSLTPSPYEPHPELYSYEAAVNGDYPDEAELEAGG